MKRSKDALHTEWLAFVKAHPWYAHNCALKRYFFRKQFLEDYHRFKKAGKYVERALRELDS